MKRKITAVITSALLFVILTPIISMLMPNAFRSFSPALMNSSLTSAMPDLIKPLIVMSPYFLSKMLSAFFSAIIGTIILRETNYLLISISIVFSSVIFIIRNFILNSSRDLGANIAYYNLINIFYYLIVVILVFLFALLGIWILDKIKERQITLNLSNTGGWLKSLPTNLRKSLLGLKD